MRQDNSKNPILQGILKKMTAVPKNEGYVFDSIDDTNVNGETPLHIAAISGDLEIGITLLDTGANPNWPDERYGNTPLHKAVSEKQYEFTNLLLSRGASQEIKNNEGLTPLDLATKLNDSRLVLIFSSWPISHEKSQRPEVFEALKDASSTADNAGYVFKNIHDTNSVGDTALHVAARRGDIGTAKILLDIGANPNAVGEYGYTPFHGAISSKNFNLIKLFLEHGASKEQRNEDGLTPMDLARRSNDQRLLELLSV